MSIIKKHKDIIIYSLLLAFYGIILLLRSPYSPGATIIPGADSAVFTYMGQGLSRGLVPYKDLFDHKGLLIYIINWIGITLFNGTIGIWIMEIIAMFVNFFIIWKIVKLFSKNNMVAFFTIVITFLPYMKYYCLGNRVEEWAMPFIFISLYKFFKYLKYKSSILKRDWFVIGGAAAAILLCKPNLVIVDVVFLAIIGIQLLIKKQYRDIMKCIIYFLTGFIIISLPFVIYLVSNNALKDFFDAYILFNFKYVGDKGSLITILYYMVQYWSMTALSSISILVCIVGIIKCNKKENDIILLSANAIFLVLSYFIAAISGRNHEYYALMCIPAFVYPTYYALNWIFNNLEQNIKSFVICVFALTIIFISELATTGNLIIIAHTSEEPTEKVIARYVAERTSENDEVIVLGNETSINILSKRNNSAKYFFQKNIANIDEEIAREFMGWLKETEPELMVCYFKSSEKNDTYFMRELFEYLENIVEDGKYIENYEVSQDVIIYEKIK